MFSPFFLSALDYSDFLLALRSVLAAKSIIFICGACILEIYYNRQHEVPHIIWSYLLFEARTLIGFAYIDPSLKI